ncbi:MAG TPA: BCAM0308 family protein [candidate division Zixibacteria bacterium]|nr:BCAM0308 family protein [candidate division Zixibacteria bacterium]
MRSPKRYNTAYKKKVDVDRDTYLPRLAPKGTFRCGGCGAYYYRRRWSLIPPAGSAGPIPVNRKYCPACRKTKERYPNGELHLLNVEAADRGEILNILKNEQERAQQKNPLERIMNMEQAASGWKVETTTEKLAQRLGRAIRKAKGGRLAYKWSHNNKFVRVFWEKPSD